MNTVLDFQSVSRWYGEVIAVNDVDATIPTGITGLLGPNGAGKTTFMRLAMGLMRPSAGTVRVLGEDPWGNGALQARVGYVPEAPPPWPDRSGAQVVERMARLAGLDAAAATAAAAHSLEEVGLSEAAHRPVGTYSQGMQQRIKFAIATAHGPELLVLDEPLRGTDPLARRHLMEFIRARADAGASILLSTHVLQDVEALTQQILLLNHGRLMAHGDVQDIRSLLDRHPRTVRVTTPDPKALGRRLWDLDTVLAVEAEPDAVAVRTRRADAFYRQLEELLVKDPSLEFTSITSPDDSVEALFHYLVEGR